MENKSNLAEKIANMKKLHEVVNGGIPDKKGVSLVSIAKKVAKRKLQKIGEKNGN